MDWGTSYGGTLGSTNPLIPSVLSCCCGSWDAPYVVTRRGTHSHTDSVTVKVPEVVQGFKAFENHDGYNEKYFMHIEIISPISYN